MDITYNKERTPKKKIAIIISILICLILIIVGVSKILDNGLRKKNLTSIQKYVSIIEETIKKVNEYKEDSSTYSLVENSLATLYNDVVITDKNYNYQDDYSVAIDNKLTEITDYDNWSDYKAYIDTTYLPYGDDNAKNAESFLYEEKMKNTTTQSINTGKTAIGLSTSTNITSESCKGYELFGYTGDFWFSPSLSSTVYDKMYWSTNVNRDDIIENVIAYYGDNYEICDYIGYSNVYLWKDVSTFEYILCNAQNDNTTTIIWQCNSSVQNQPTKPEIGMTAEEVKKTLWGEPDDINNTTTKYGIHEQWVYKMYDKTKYVYLDDGIVTSIQE